MNLFLSMFIGMFFFLSLLPNIQGSDLNPPYIKVQSDATTFVLETTTVPNSRFKDGISFSFQNLTLDSLSNYRIFLMIKKDILLPYIPGNIHEYFLSFAGIDEEIVLPLVHNEFSLSVYKGDFNETEADTDVISSDESIEMLLFHGEELSSNTKSIKLSVFPSADN